MSTELKMVLARLSPEEHRVMVGTANLLIRMRKYGATNLDEAIQIADQIIKRKHQEKLDESKT